MQCHLVPWLLAAAVCASPIAGAFDCDEGNRVGRLTIDSATPDKEIRRKLLQHTSLGTSGVDVLSFAVNTLRPNRPINAYSGYVRAYEASTGKKLGAVRISARRISVTVTERQVALLSSERVVAFWHFDDDDRLSDIEIERTTIGP